MMKRPHTYAPTLAELQASFQAAILSGDRTILSLIPGNGRTNNEVLFGVYQYAYVGRLIEVIGTEHEYLKAYLGDDKFRTMATAFIAANPSSQQNARWFAEPLPGFLRATEPYASQPELADLALIERTLALAFDARDDNTVALADLETIDPEDWEGLVFSAHPSVSVLQLSTNALALWTALKDGNSPPDLKLSDLPKAIQIWRHGTTPMIRSIADEEAMMWSEAAQGVNFGRLCELLVVFGDPDTAPLRAAQYLAGWLTNGLIAKFQVTVGAVVGADR